MKAPGEAIISGGGVRETPESGVSTLKLWGCFSDSLEFLPQYQLLHQFLPQLLIQHPNDLFLAVAQLLP